MEQWVVTFMGLEFLFKNSVDSTKKMIVLISSFLELNSCDCLKPLVLFKFPQKCYLILLQEIKLYYTKKAKSCLFLLKQHFPNLLFVNVKCSFPKFKKKIIMVHIFQLLAFFNMKNKPTCKIASEIKTLHVQYETKR